MTPEEKLIDACKKGRYKVIECLVSRGLVTPWAASYYIFLYGRRKFIDLHIDCFPDWEGALCGACQRGDMDLVRSIFNGGVVFDSEELRFGFGGACAGGHEDIVNFMIEQMEDPDYNYGLIVACDAGKENVVKLMLEKGATDLFSARDTAEFAKHQHIIDLLGRYTRDQTIKALRSKAT